MVSPKEIHRGIDLPTSLYFFSNNNNNGNNNNKSCFMVRLESLTLIGNLLRDIVSVKILVVVQP